MSEKELNVEEQKRKTRRKLLKLAAYSIPAVSSILAASDAYAKDDDDNKDGTKRKEPNGPKKHKKGVS